MNSLSDFFSSDGFMPHGHCYLWRPDLLWLNVVSDTLIALAYMTIPITLMYFVRKRRDIPFDWMLVAFGIFILACGTTHIMEIWVIWNPDYWIVGVIKAVTAAASAITAILLVKLLPTALTIPSPKQLEKVNQQLQQSNSELLHAKEQAEVANRARGVFLTNMSHELRTPLNVLMGYAQMLKRTLDLPERQSKGVNAILQSSQQLLALISDILDLSKIDAGKVELASRPIDLKQFLTQIIEMVSVRAAQKGIELYCSFEDELPEVVVVDDKRLRQVLLNLLSNAVKFTDAGSVGLMVNAVSATPGNTDLYFEVTDSGIGMSEDDLNIIFNSFEQVGDIDRKAGGSGLGLDISQQLVHLMGGQIQASSISGLGSRFRFTITVPLFTDPLQPTDTDIMPTGYAGLPRSILVVDDVAANREMLLELLDSLGFKVMEAADGNAALALIDSLKPDLIILDLMMKGMRGDELVRRIRAALHTMPIIMASASALPEDQQACEEAGVNCFLSKPVDQDVLVQHLGHLLMLNWVYGKRTRDIQHAKSDIVPPPDATLQALHQLAVAGDISAIHRFAEQLVAKDARYVGFARQLREVANSFRTDAIVACVESYMEGSSQ